jgi:toxin ParE1/3/4
MARIIRTEPALSDLNEIAEYIALDKLNAARRLVKQVFSGVDRLEQFPESGRIPPELKRSKYREIIVGPFQVFLSC